MRLDSGHPWVVEVAFPLSGAVSIVDAEARLPGPQK